VSETREPTRLIVMLDVAEGASERLAAALGVADIASVVIAPLPGKDLVAGDVQPLVIMSQKAGAAALLLDDARLARTLKADGVHLGVVEACERAYEEAREIMGTRGIVGIDVGRSRHDAMQAGEAGAEYVGFGIPAHVKERETAIERRRELVAWWAEIFEIPCVAFDVETPEEARLLASEGADFIAVSLRGGVSPSEVREIVARFAAAIADAPTPQTGAA
jgi:thiamine-phosphate pyrophosphorylase